MIRLILITGLLLLPVYTHQDSDLVQRLSKDFQQKEIWKTQSRGTPNRFTPKKRTTTVFTSEPVTPTYWPVSTGNRVHLHSIIQEKKEVDSQGDTTNNRNVRLNINRNLNTNQIIEAGTNKLRTLWLSKTNEIKTGKDRFVSKKKGSAQFLPLLQAKFQKGWKKDREQLKTSYAPNPRPSRTFNNPNEKSQLDALLKSTQNFTNMSLINSRISKQNMRHRYQRNYQTISNNSNSVNISTSSDRLALTDRRHQLELPRSFGGLSLQQDSKIVNPESPVLGSVLGIAKNAETQKQGDIIGKVMKNIVSSTELENKSRISKNSYVSSLSEANTTTEKMSLSRSQPKKDIVFRTKNLRNLSSLLSIRLDDVNILEKSPSLVFQDNAVENSGITLKKNSGNGRNLLSQVGSLKVLGLNQREITPADAGILQNINKMATDNNLVIPGETDVRHLNRKNNDGHLNIDKDLLRINKIRNEANATKMSRSNFNASNFDSVRKTGSNNVFSKIYDPTRFVANQDNKLSHLNIPSVKKKIESSNVDNIGDSRLATALIKKLMRIGASVKSGLKWSRIKSNSLQPTDVQRTSVNGQSKPGNIKQHGEIIADKTLNKKKLSKTVLDFLVKLSTYLQLRNSNDRQPLERSGIPSMHSKVLTLLGLPEIKTDLSALLLLNEATEDKFPFKDVQLVDSGLKKLHGVSKTIVSSPETNKMAQLPADTRGPGNSDIVKDVRDYSSSHLQADRKYLRKPLDLNNAKTTQVDWDLHGLLRPSDVMANVSTLLKFGDSDVVQARKLTKRRENLVDLGQIKSWNAKYEDIGQSDIPLIKRGKALPANYTLENVGFKTDFAKSARVITSPLLHFGHLVNKNVQGKLDLGLIDPLSLSQSKTGESALLGLDHLITGRHFERSGRKTDFVDLSPLNEKESYNVTNTDVVLRGSVKRPLDISKKIRDKNLQGLSVGSPIIKPDMSDSDILNVLKTLNISNTLFTNISGILELGKSFQNKPLPKEMPISPSMKPVLSHSDILGVLKSLGIPNEVFVNISAHLEHGKSFLNKSLPGEIGTLPSINSEMFDSAILGVLKKLDIPKKVFVNISAILEAEKSFQNKPVPSMKSGLPHSGILDVLKSLDIPNKVFANISADLKLGKSFSDSVLPSEIPTLASIEPGLQNSSISRILANLSSARAYVDLLQRARRNNLKFASADSSILSRIISPGTSKNAFPKLPFLLKPTKSGVSDETPLKGLKPDLAHLLSIVKLRAAGVPFDGTVNVSTLLKLGILDKVNRFELSKAQHDLTSTNLLDVLKLLHGSSFVLANVSKLHPLNAGKLANLFEDRLGLVSVDINILGLLIALGVPPNILANIYVQLGTLGVPDVEKETLRSFLETRKLLRQLAISNDVFKILLKAPAIALDKDIFISKVLPELLKVDLRDLPSTNSSRILGKVLTTLMIIVGDHKPKRTGLVDVLQKVHKRHIYPGKQRTDGNNASQPRLLPANRTDFQMLQSLVAEQNFEKLSLIETVFVLEILNKLCIKHPSKSAICDAIRQYTTTSLVTDIMGLAFNEKRQRDTPFSSHYISTDAYLKLCLSASFSSLLHPFCQRVMTSGTKPPISPTLSVVQPEISKRPEFHENKTYANTPTRMLSLPMLFHGTAASAVPPIPTSRLSFSQLSNVGSKISKAAETDVTSSRTSLPSAFGSVKLCQYLPDLCRKIEHTHASKQPTRLPNIAELLKKISTKKQPSAIRTVPSPKVVPELMPLNMVQTTQSPINLSLLSSLLRPVQPGAESLSRICLTAALLNVQSNLCQNSTNLSSSSSATAKSFSLSQLLQVIASKIPPGSEARPIAKPLTQMSSGVNLVKPYVGHRKLLLPTTDEFSYSHGHGSATTGTKTARPSLHSFTSSDQEPTIDKFINLCASVSINSPLFPLCQQVRKVTAKTSHPETTTPPATQTSTIDLYRQLMELTKETMSKRANERSAKPFTIMPTSNAQSNTLQTILKSSALPYVRQEKQPAFLEDFAKFLQKLKLMERFNARTLTNKNDKEPTPNISSMRIKNAIPTKATRENTLATIHKPASLTINRNAISPTAYNVLSSKTIKTENKTSSKNIISLRDRIISGKILPKSVESQVNINKIKSRSNISPSMTSAVSRSPLIDVLKKLLSVLERHLEKPSPPVKSALQEIRKKPEVIRTIGTPSETTLSKTTAPTPLLSPRVSSPSNNFKPRPKAKKLKGLNCVYKPKLKLANYLTIFGKPGRHNEAMSYPKETSDRRVNSLMPSLLSRHRTISSILRRMGYIPANERHFPLTSNRHRTTVNGILFPVLSKKDSQRQKSRYATLPGRLNAINRTSNLRKLHERPYPQMEQSREPLNHLSEITTSKINALLRILDSLHQSDLKRSQDKDKALKMQRYVRLLDEGPTSQKTFLRANSEKSSAPTLAISPRIPVSIHRDLLGEKTAGDSLTKRFWQAILAPETLNLNIRNIQVPVGNKGNNTHFFNQKVSLFNTGEKF